MGNRLRSGEGDLKDKDKNELGHCCNSPMRDEGIYCGASFFFNLYMFFMDLFYISHNTHTHTHTHTHTRTHAHTHMHAQESNLLKAET